jgi:hypothetical protein
MFLMLFDTAYMVDDILFLLDDGLGVLYVFFCYSRCKFYVTTTYVIHGYHYCLFLDLLLVILEADIC